MARKDGPSTQPGRGGVTITLSSPFAEVAVRVRLRDVGDRWVAVADCPNQTQVGLGGTAREALAACLSPLGPRVSSALQADPALFGASLAV
jgi:hypothetical protein